MRRTSAEFPPTPASARRARAFVHTAIDLGPEQSEVAQLLISELASNAIIHAGSPFRVTVVLTDDLVRIECDDADGEAPQPVDQPGGSVDGRGLQIVSRLADRWGVELHGEGKTVWFELRRPGNVAPASPPAGRSG